MTSPQRGEHDTPQHAPTDERLLAAVKRAGRHHRPEAGHAAPVWAIVEHLGLSRRQGPGRRIRSHLEALVRRGWLEQRKRQGSPLWELTPAGTRAIERALSAGTAIELPESPQHRTWRNARTSAALEVGRFEVELLALLRGAVSMLGADPGPSPMPGSRSPSGCGWVRDCTARRSTASTSGTSPATSRPTSTSTTIPATSSSPTPSARGAGRGAGAGATPRYGS